MRLHGTILVVALAVLTLTVTDASADCVDPVGESATQSGSSVTLHTYPDEAIVCIGEPTEYCEECQAGFEHICRHDRWAPLRTRACDTSPEPLSVAATTGYTRGIDTGSPDRTATRRMFDALQSCQYLGYEEETYAYFMGELAEENLQNASMSELKDIIRNEHEVELTREIRQVQGYIDSSWGDERESYEGRMRSLNEERAKIQCVLRTAGD